MIRTEKVLFIMVGAEGCAETEGCDWVRSATPEEEQAFRTACGDERYHELGIDGMGRPYWLKAVLPNAPEEARKRASEYKRVLRLLD